MPTKVKEKTKSATKIAVNQVWVEPSTKRHWRVVRLSRNRTMAACAYRHGGTGRFTALTEDIPVRYLRAPRFHLVRGG